MNPPFVLKKISHICSTHIFPEKYFFLERLKAVIHKVFKLFSFYICSMRWNKNTWIKENTIKGRIINYWSISNSLPLCSLDTFLPWQNQHLRKVKNIKTAKNHWGESFLQTKNIMRKFLESLSLKFMKNWATLILILSQGRIGLVTMVSFQFEVQFFWFPDFNLRSKMRLSQSIFNVPV